MTILVVDDVEFVRSICKLALEANGHEVILAEDGSAGLELFLRNAGRIGLSLIDLRLPGIEGFDLARQMRAVNPAANIVLMSGGNARSSVPPDLAADCGVLDKPFTVPALKALVSERLQMN
jgi:CheY-like chemotaxis protein